MANTHRELDGKDTWVEFAKSGYPFKLARQLKETQDELVILSTIAKYIVACKIPTIGGTILETIPDAKLLDDVDEQHVVALIREFYTFRQERMYSPLEKNS